MPESSKGKREIAFAIGQVENPTQRHKLFLMNLIKKTEPTEEAKKAMENITVEAVEVAVVKHQSNQWVDMVLYDRQYMCESVIKAGLNVTQFSRWRQNPDILGRKVEYCFNI